MRITMLSPLSLSVVKDNCSNIRITMLSLWWFFPSYLRRSDQGGVGIINVMTVLIFVICFAHEYRCQEVNNDNVAPAPAPSLACDNCVSSIQVGFQLGVSLSTLLALFTELQKEIAEGVYLQQSQVSITSFTAVGTDNQQEVTDVVAGLKPLGSFFDEPTAEFIGQRFWKHEVYLNETLFGSYYTVQYVISPGAGPIGAPSVA